MVLRKTILTDSKSKGGHLGHPSFPVMYEFVIPVTVISVILHFKRFRLLNSAGTSYYKSVITRSELQVVRTSSDVRSLAGQLHLVIPATTICTIQCHRKCLCLLRCLDDGAHANTHAHRIHQFRPTNEDTFIYILNGLTDFVCCKYRQHENKIIER